VATADKAGTGQAIDRQTPEVEPAGDDEEGPGEMAPGRFAVARRESE
jgi:hypothetical protein